MNERIKELAEQAGFYKYGSHFEEIIERFAELVRDDEREACAELCENASELMNSTFNGAAKAIRQRGEK